VTEIDAFRPSSTPTDGCTWETTITNAATYTVGPAANPVDDIAQHYEDLIKKPNP